MRRNDRLHLFDKLSYVCGVIRERVRLSKSIVIVIKIFTRNFSKAFRINVYILLSPQQQVALRHQTMKGLLEQRRIYLLGIGPLARL